MNLWKIVRRIIAVLLLIGIVFMLVATAYWIRTASYSPLLNTVALGHLIKLKVADEIILSGKGGWLFLNDDFRCLLKRWPNDRNSRTIIALNDTLRSMGIHLLLVPVPTKVEICQDKFSPFTTVQASNQRKRLLDGLSRRGVDVLDLAEPFWMARNRNSLFQKKDMHWDAEGIELAADLIARRISGLVLADTAVAYTERDSMISKQGDLALFAGDSSYYPCTFRSVFNPDGSPYRGEPASGIMIFGDSFTNVYRYHNASIAPRISYNLKAPTYTYYGPHGNTEGPRRLLLRLRKTGRIPKVVVWIFLSRYFMKEMI